MITYYKFFDLLNRRNIKIGSFSEETQISRATIAKMRKNKNINSSVISRICKHLNCSPCDIMEYEKEVD